MLTKTTSPAILQRTTYRVSGFSTFLCVHTVVAYLWYDTGTVGAVSAGALGRDTSIVVGFSFYIYWLDLTL